MKLLLHNDKVIIAIPMPFDSDSDKRLEYILAYYKQQCTNMFIMKRLLRNDAVIITIPLPFDSDIYNILKYILAQHSL